MENENKKFKPGRYHARCIKAAKAKTMSKINEAIDTDLKVIERLTKEWKWRQRRVSLLTIYTALKHD